MSAAGDIRAEHRDHGVQAGVARGRDLLPGYDTSWLGYWGAQLSGELVECDRQSPSAGDICAEHKDHSVQTEVEAENLIHESCCCSRGLEMTGDRLQRQPEC